MNVKELRKLIREEVKFAIRQELKDLLVEAVTIAATAPQQQEEVKPFKVETKKPMQRPVLDETAVFGGNSLNDVLEATRKGMTPSDLQEMSTSIQGDQVTEGVSDRAMPGDVDLSSIPGLGKASQVFKEAQAKSKQHRPA